MCGGGGVPRRFVGIDGRPVINNVSNKGDLFCLLEAIVRSAYCRHRLDELITVSVGTICLLASFG